MTRSTLHSISTKKPLATQPVFTNRIAKTRKTYRHPRKIQAKLGQIVYGVFYNGFDGYIEPMRVIEIEDWQNISRSFKQDLPLKYKRGYMIYYWLQPLIKKNGKWIPKQFRRISYTDVMVHNNHVWSSGWIGHSVDMDEFYLTCAEANHAMIKYRPTMESRRFNYNIKYRDE